MKFTKEEKIAFVKRCQDGETVLSICNENQIPRSTFYRWIQDYQQTTTDTGTVVTPQEFLYMKRRINKLEDRIQFKDGRLYGFLTSAGKTQGHGAALRAIRCSYPVTH